MKNILFLIAICFVQIAVMFYRIIKELKTFLFYVVLLFISCLILKYFTL